MNSRILALAAFAAAFGAPAAQANDPTYVDLGAGQIFVISQDGTTILTNTAGGLGVETLGGGFTAIGNQALGINHDGSAVAGTVAEEPALWNAGGWTMLGGIVGGGPCGSSIGTGYDVAGDGTLAGSTVVGLAWDGCQARGFKWTQATGMVELPQSGPGSSRASAISEDGKVIGGFDEAANGSRRAAIWDENLNQTLPLVSASNPDGAGEVLYINNDGSAYCGSEFSEAWVWSATNGYTAIPRPPAGVGLFSNFYATGCTDDGRIVVGGSTGFFDPPIAWIWTEWGGTQSIEDFLATYGITVANPADFGACRGISADGTVIVGDSGVPFFSMRWQINIPSPLTESYCTAGTSASGCQATLSFTGVASATNPSGFVVSAANVEGGKDGLFFYGNAGRQAVTWYGGTSYRCVAAPVWRGALLTGTGTNGMCDGSFSDDLNANWTAKPQQNPGAGNYGQVQLWYRDPANTTGNVTTSMSNALEYFVCP